MTAADPGSAVVVIPTYNERDNLPVVVGRLLALTVPGLRVLVVDDGSPDGTGEVADALARDGHGRVEVLHRPVKDGLGRAYVTGMTHALAQDPSAVVQMDADLSHPVEALPILLAALRDGPADVAVGSRYTDGGSTAKEWPWRRRALSRAANAYVNGVLRLGVRDVTSGYKAWRANSLRDLDLPSLDAQGYAFQIEMAFRCREQGLVVEEVPIHFSERSHGSSKMTFSVQAEAALLPWRLRRHPHLSDRASTAPRAEPGVLVGER